MVNRSAAPEVLAQIAVRRFDYAVVPWVFAAKADQAAGDYVRFNPVDAIGWHLTGRARQQTVNSVCSRRAKVGRCARAGPVRGRAGA